MQKINTQPFSTLLLYVFYVYKGRNYNLNDYSYLQVPSPSATTAT